MAGKAPESAGLKAVVEAFNQLSPEEQTLFRSKVLQSSAQGYPRNKEQLLKRNVWNF